MKIIRVQYTVKENYVDQNKTNIKAVMDDLRATPIEGMHYSSYYLGDGKFMHFSRSKDAETAAQLNNRELFNKFRTELKASGPIESPKAEDLELVGSNSDVI